MIKSAVNLPLNYDTSKITISDNSIEILYSGKPFPLVLNQGKYKLEAYGAIGGGIASSYTIARKTDGTKDCLYDSATVDKYI